MALGIKNLQWLNHNSQRSYPIVDWASSTDTTGTVTIPDNFILALDFPVHAGLAVEPEKFYIQTLGIFATGFNIAIGYADGVTNPLVASVNISHATHTEYRSYALAGSDDFDDSVGKLVIGKLDEIDLLPAGVYNFAPAATTLETDAIRPMIRGISALTVVNGADQSERITGDVELVAGNNMRIVVNQISGVSPQVVFSAIAGEGLNEECACEEETDAVAIQFINGIPPLPNGNYRIVGDDCIDVQPITHGLQLVDSCSEPCCGCDELEALTRQIDRFADGVITVQTFQRNSQAEIVQMSQVVLGSRLHDDGCIEC